MSDWAVYTLGDQDTAYYCSLGTNSRSSYQAQLDNFVKWARDNAEVLPKLGSMEEHALVLRYCDY